LTELLLYLYAESPVHAGAAESLGALDLPVQREATTGYPVIWGQSLKGALRQAAQELPWEPQELTAVFGSSVNPAGEGGETTAGLLAVGDAQLVALPVPTLQHTFAWATSELALGRLARKYAVLAGGAGAPPPVPAVAPDRGAASSADWVGEHRPQVLGPCLVELGAQPSQPLSRWAERLAADALGSEPVGFLAGKLRTDLVLVGSDVMPLLGSECTEFVARVQLNQDKTVEQGPFYGEYLPAETILAASLTLRADPHRPAGPYLERLRQLLHGRLLQVGGDETIGKGLVWARLVGGPA
jgi:CRISPR-associated protein Cmr4